VPVRYYDWIAHFGRRTPEKVAVVDLASQRRITYAQFDARISRLAGHLRNEMKVARGDRVAVLALNTTDTLEVQFACGRLDRARTAIYRRRCVTQSHDP
jgi:fatty-acyl-CoA synthase